MDWGTAAAVIVAAAAVIGLIIQFFKKDKPWRDISEDHRVRLSKLELEVKHLNEIATQLRTKIDEHDARDQKDFERIESKIEKVTDLMIQLIQHENPQPPTQTKRTRKPTK